jgi:UDP-N-acetylmuramate--alanine ligase
VAGLIDRGHRDAHAIDGEAGLAELVRANARPGDLVVCLGAGTISGWANRLPEALKSPQLQEG